ncbi:hypothetical protein QA649_08985 [Bradyrhizobium sp. CB1717]|uniref:hypothetical protein n=1 Tax=Bradyrhizobium sp. CB1717 TaxID=3039154 RepID=UPI0024B25DA0|nr:hypothetical protein [Bradyrhizobium sp. CB1717]WFU26325.1 hypothetical protein QA649_08985 [Bradyrhizobium sp. CB1717]
MLRLATLIATFLWISVSASAQPIDRPETFQAWEGGGFLLKTWKELGSQEAQALITAGCAAYGVDCSSQAAAIRAAAQQSRQYYRSGNVATTARIDRHPGEEYYAKFDSPNGYTICKAAIDIKNGSITGPSTFNGSIQRTGEDGLGLYAVVPKNRPTGQWVRFNLVVRYVPAGTLQQYDCWPNNTLVVQCTGQNCNTYDGARIP